MPPGWFGSERIAWGARPTSLQGWAVTGLYVVIAVVLARTLVARHVALFWQHRSCSWSRISSSPA